jgi:hypothetical protein
MKPVLSILFSVLFFCVPAFGWDYSGHEAIAQIAYDQLQAYPKVKAAVDKVFLEDPRHRTILRASTWPDFIILESKEQRDVDDPNFDEKEQVYVDGFWHFVDIPYDADEQTMADAINNNGETPDPAKPHSANVVTAIRYYEALLPTLGDDKAQERADALSFLIHFIGDAHQPLHCVTVLKAIPGYDPVKNERADIGGNGFAIKWPVATWKRHQDNLHSLWDDQLELGQELPIYAIPATAAALEKENSAADLSQELAKTDPADWARESYSYRQFAYGTTYGGTPDENYLKQAKEIADRRIALAGYRLARALVAIYGGDPQSYVQPVNADGLVAIGSEKPETIVFVRHGEKPDSDEGQLTSQGLNRALALPDVLIRKFGNADAIFAPGTQTEVQKNGVEYSYIRPLVTIEPTAIRLGLPVHAQFGYDDTQDLRNALLDPQYGHSTIFVAWEHRELVVAVRAILAALGRSDINVPEWKGKDYDSIYVLKLAGTGNERTVAFSTDKEGLDGQSVDDPKPAK